MSFEQLAEDDESAEAHERRIKRCRGCNARIIWLRTPEGKNCPADEATVEAGEYEWRWGVHTCHFDTCTKPGTYSARRL